MQLAHSRLHLLTHFHAVGWSARNFYIAEMSVCKNFYWAELQL